MTEQRFQPFCYDILEEGANYIGYNIFLKRHEYLSLMKTEYVIHTLICYTEYTRLCFLFFIHTHTHTHTRDALHNLALIYLSFLCYPFMTFIILYLLSAQNPLLAEPQIHCLLRLPRWPISPLHFRCSLCIFILFLFQYLSQYSFHWR